MTKTCYTTDWKTVTLDANDVQSVESRPPCNGGLAVCRIVFKSARPPLLVHTTEGRFADPDDNDLTVDLK
jgi:hypothetical protein